MRTVARVPVSRHSGSLGVEGVFARRCPTVRNRPRPSHVALLRFAEQAWHFVTFRRVSQCVESRGRRSTLEVSIVILRGRRSALDVYCVVCFCESLCQGCVKWR